MKRLRRRIVASSNTLASQPVITPNDMLKFLLQLPELQAYNIALEESPAGSIIFTVGDNLYEFSDTEQQACM